MVFIRFINYLFRVDCCKEECCIIKCCGQKCFIMECQKNEKEILSIDEEWQNILKESNEDFSIESDDSDNSFSIQF